MTRGWTSNHKGHKDHTRDTKNRCDVLTTQRPMVTTKTKPECWVGRTRYPQILFWSEGSTSVAEKLLQGGTQQYRLVCWLVREK